ncbi:MAG: tripartite tricarboxylate transporter substrate binding protein [Burkholderiaceae bacterium]
MILKKKIIPLLVLLFGFGSCLAAPGDYPVKPIKMIISFPPGGPTDSTLRIIAEKLGELMKQPVFIENKAGAAGNVGTQLAARAEPDGYTFLASSSAFAVNPSMYAGKAGYDPIKDFVPVVVVTTQPNVISVNEKVPVKNFAELKALTINGKLSFSSPGSGTTPHLTCENIFRVNWKSDIVHVPYKGAGPASLAVVAGDTPVACTAAFGVFQFHKQGRVKILGISSDKRLPSLPDVPTFAEMGYPDINDYTWTTIFAPAGTPVAIVEKMNQAVNQILAMPEFKEKFDKGGLITVGGSLQETADYIAAEVKRWALVVKMTGAKAE